MNNRKNCHRPEKTEISPFFQNHIDIMTINKDNLIVGFISLGLIVNDTIFSSSNSPIPVIVIVAVPASILFE